MNTLSGNMSVLKNRYNQEVIDRINALINDKGVTKSKVAERCGIHPSTLSKLLNGHPVTQLRPEKVQRLLEYLERVNTNDI